MNDINYSQTSLNLIKFQSAKGLHKTLMTNEFNSYIT